MKPFLGKRGTASTLRYQGFNDLLSDWEQLKQLYLQKSAGPSKLEVLSGWLESAATAGRAAVLGGFGTGNGGEEEPTAATAGRE